MLTKAVCILGPWEVLIKLWILKFLKLICLFICFHSRLYFFRAVLVNVKTEQKMRCIPVSFSLSTQSLPYRAHLALMWHPGYNRRTSRDAPSPTEVSQFALGFAPCTEQSYGFWQMHTDMCPPLHNSFTLLKILCDSPVHSSLPPSKPPATMDLFTFSRMLCIWIHTVCSLFRLASSTQ